MIDREYERLIEAGRVGFYLAPRDNNPGRFRVGPDCQRSGCHRTRTRRVGSWDLCGPCADAIEGRTSGKHR